ncbi:MAG: hypothetical protein KDA25_09495 [Phycisphaerales bacterium]|nr:hypothetical protein [Phycisphaerales bacterium]
MRSRLSIAALIAATTLAMPAFGQQQGNFPVGERVPFELDTGFIANAGPTAKVLYQDTVTVNGGAFVRLYFEPVRLEPGSFIRITSLLDGEVQELDAAGLAAWNYSSAYFNGDTVTVELIGGPNTQNNRLTILDLDSQFGNPIPTGSCGICGPDNRTLSGELWSARLFPAGCSASVYNADSCMVSAGHCIESSNVVQFNVPLSNPDCSTNNPPVADQFPIIAVQFQNGGVGADWAAMKAGTNNQGQTPFQRYGQSRPLAGGPPSVGNATEIWGYGVDSQCERSQVQQYSPPGQVTSVQPNFFLHNSDATFGNSGSGILVSNVIYGINTHCPCDNVATRIDLPAFVAARAAVCQAGGDPCGPGSGPCDQPNGTPGCDDVACCQLICGQDPFCCDTEWDQICANAAIEQCVEPSVCGPGAGPCDIPNGSPGCDDVACCEAVCAVDPFCCDTEWDQICANEAAEICAVQGPCGPGAGPFDVPNGSPGCDDVECCETVCAVDPFCCETEWDQICANEAIDLCGGPPTTCCDGSELAEGEACGADTNGGCNSTPVAFVEAACGDTYCGTAWADAGTRDTDWYRVTLTNGGTLSGTLQSEFDGVVFIVDGIAACAPVVIGETGASVNCTPGTASAVVGPGQYVVFVATNAFEGYPCDSGNNDYRLAISCDKDPGDACNPNAGPCDVPNGTPGCDDIACCELICSQDPFCCDTEWDQICANAALEQCVEPTVCGPGAGPCDVPNGTPGCDDVDCCELICFADPFCCETEWDQICADAAIAQCGGPVGPINDDCADRIAIFDGGTPYSTIDATTDGNVHAACQFDGQTYHDVWYNYTATCNGPLTISTCNAADYDTDLAVYATCDAADCPPGDADLIACNDDFSGCSGFTSEVTIDAVCGACYKIRVGGWNDGDQGTGTLTITCNGDCGPKCPCVWDLDGDCDVDPSDLANLLASWGAPYGPADLAALLAEWGCSG